MLKKIAELEITTEKDRSYWCSKLVKTMKESGVTVIETDEYTTPHYLIATNDNEDKA